MGFTNSKVPFLMGPSNEDYPIFGGLYWGPPIYFMETHASVKHRNLTSPLVS